MPDLCVPLLQFFKVFARKNGRHLATAVLLVLALQLRVVAVRQQHEDVRRREREVGGNLALLVAEAAVRRCDRFAFPGLGVCRGAQQELVERADVHCVYVVVEALVLERGVSGLDELRAILPRLPGIKAAVAKAKGRERVIIIALDSKVVLDELGQALVAAEQREQVRVQVQVAGVELGVAEVGEQRLRVKVLAPQSFQELRALVNARDMAQVVQSALLRLLGLRIVCRLFRRSSYYGLGCLNGSLA